MTRPAAVIVAILAIAVPAVAAISPPLPNPLGARIVIESDPLTVTARLPEGWTMEGGTIVLPDEVRSFNAPDGERRRLKVLEIEPDNTPAGLRCRWDSAALVGSLAIEK